MKRKIACIDLGSNSFLLTITEVDSSKNIRIICDVAEVIGLVKKLDLKLCVSPEALDRAKVCLRRYRDLIKTHGVTEVYAVATASLRRPTNSIEVKKDLEEVLGHSIEIISGEKEAKLSFSSVRLDPLCPIGNKIVFDIGGASTEIISGNDKNIEQLISIPIGSVLLNEKFELDRPCHYLEALNFMGSTLSSHLKFSSDRVSKGIGVAGTVTSLLASELQLEVYDRQRVHGQSFSREQLKIWIERISKMTLEERKKITGLTPARADVFLGGLIIILSLMEHFNWRNFHCFDTGVRFGLLYEKI